VSDAVRASAAFPGLPRVVLDPVDAGFAGYEGSLALRDGGTSDNLGHLHQTLFSAQQQEMRSFLTSDGALRRWIVVDSSAPRASRGRRPQWLLRLVELLNLGAAADMAEMAGTAASERTSASSALIAQHLAQTGDGVYLDIGTSPFEHARAAVIESWDADGGEAAIETFHRTGEWPEGGPDDDRGRRAQAALSTVVSASEPVAAKPDWAARSEENALARTTLNSLGADRTEELVRHGFVLAAVACHMDLGWSLPTPEAMGARRFRNLIAGQIDLDMSDLGVLARNKSLAANNVTGGPV